MAVNLQQSTECSKADMVGLVILDLKFTHNLVGGFYKMTSVAGGLVASLSVVVAAGCCRATWFVIFSRYFERRAAW
jgi:hypothetical protein